MGAHLRKRDAPKSAFKKKRTKTGGRTKGVPNKVTMEVRHGIKMVAEGNMPKVDKWLDRVAKKRPDKAMDLFLRLIEYHVPKLTRTEHVGEAPPREMGELPLNKEEAWRVYQDFISQAPAIDHEGPVTVIEADTSQGPVSLPSPETDAVFVVSQPEMQTGE